MSANVQQVLLTAQSYLNDFGQKMWVKENLQQFLAEAHRDLQLQLQLNGIPVIKKKSAIATIPIVGLNPYTGPVQWPEQSTALADLIQPLECWERPTGSTLESDWNLMIPKSFLPAMDPVQDLIYWSWMEEQILFIGSTASKDAKLYYNGGIKIPVADEDVMGFLNAEAYIAPHLAALAATSVGAPNLAARLDAIANKRLELILQANILAEQGMPIARRPYRHGRVPFVIR